MTSMEPYDSDQVLDSMLVAGEAEELDRIQAGLNLDAGLAAIMGDRSCHQSPRAGTGDSGEPQILTEAASYPESPRTGHPDSRSQNRVLFAVDIAGFNEHRHDDGVQRSVRQALYKVLTQAFEDAELGWDDCLHEDRGDGALIIVPERMAPATVVEPLVDRLDSCLRHHNAMSNQIAKIRLRVAIHSGEVHRNSNGVFGNAIIHVFRLLDAPALKNTLAASGADLALIVSDHFYDSVIRRAPGTIDPGRFRPATVAIKETRTRGWLHLPESPHRPCSRPSTTPATPPPLIDPASSYKRKYSLAGTTAAPEILPFRWVH